MCLLDWKCGFFFYLTAHCIVNYELLIALWLVEGIQDFGMRVQGGESAAEWQEKEKPMKLWRTKISFEKALESTGRLKNVMEEGTLRAKFVTVWDGSDSLATLTAECGFLKIRKEVIWVVESESDQGKGLQWRQGQGRDISNGNEIETERHKEEKKEFMNLLQPQGFLWRPKIGVYHHCWQELARPLEFEPLKLLQILSIWREIPLYIRSPCSADCLSRFSISWVLLQIARKHSDYKVAGEVEVLIKGDRTELIKCSVAALKIKGRDCGVSVVCNSLIRAQRLKKISVIWFFTSSGY